MNPTPSTPGSGAVHSGDCIYCEHGPYCVTCPPPSSVEGPVCGDCHEKIITAEISADPYCRGDHLAMFGDDE